MPQLRRPLADIIARSEQGIPFLVPEVQLLYKSKQARSKDDSDFRAVLPALSGAARQWLRESLALTAPSHPWLASLQAC